MKYQEFKEELLKKLKERLPEEQGYTISIEEKKKIEMLLVAKTGWDYKAAISPKKYYKLASRHGERIDELAEMIQGTIQEVMQEMDPLMKVAEQAMKVDLNDYASVKDLLRVELVRSENNGAYLSEGIYEKQIFGALVPYVEVPVEGGVAEVKISFDMLAEYGITQRALLDQAMENTKNKNPEFIEKIDTQKLGVWNFGADCFAVTNSEKSDGAAAIMYPGVMEKLYEMMGKDYYVVPLDISGVLAIEKNGNVTVEKLKKALSKENRKMSPQEKLGNKICEYSGETKVLSICKSEKSRKMER